MIVFNGTNGIINFNTTNGVIKFVAVLQTTEPSIVDAYIDYDEILTTYILYWKVKNNDVVTADVYSGLENPPTSFVNTLAAGATSGFRSLDLGLNTEATLYAQAKVSGQIDSTIASQYVSY